MSSVKLDALRAQVEILRHVKQREAELKELKAQAREQIEELMAHSDADEGTIDGRPVISWRHYKRKALNQKLLKQLHPDVYAECEDTTEYSRFEVLLRPATTRLTGDDIRARDEYVEWAYQQRRRLR